MYVVATTQGPMFAKFQTQKRRALEKRRIQTLKSWHEDLKRIAKSEMDFINSILQDDKDSEDRDWSESDQGQERGGEMVKKDA